MADDEISRAYAEYMGAGTGSGNAYTANEGQQYYYPVAPPAAPDPPSVAPPAWYALPHYDSHSYSMPPPPRPPGYVELPRNYADRPAIAAYSVGWQYTDPLPPPPMSSKVVSDRATAGSLAPSSRSVSGDVVEPGSREKWRRCYSYEYERETPAPTNPPSAAVPPEPPQQGVPAIPVLLCHTCSECGRIRSAGFHRANPIIPNQDVVQGVCRRCTKKMKRSEGEDDMHRFIRIRKCTADEPCTWPDESIHIQIRDGREHRGRLRSRSFDRDEVYVSRRRSSSPPRVIKRSGSLRKVGIQLLQRNRSAPRVQKRKEKGRYASVSPPRESRTVKDTVTIRNRSDGPPPPLRYEYTRPDEPMPRPPVQSRSRYTSPIRHRTREEHYESEAVDRMASHPMPYRPVLPDHRDAHSPTRAILKPPGMDHETSYRRRMMLHDSQESTKVEVGGPRVTFVSERVRVPSKAVPESTTGHHRMRPGRQDLDETQHSIENFKYYRRQAGAATPYLVEEPLPPRHRSPSPPKRAFEEMHIRHISPPPRDRSPVRYSAPYLRSQSQERVTIDYRSFRDPDPPSPSNRMHFRYRTVSHPPPSPPPQSARISSGYRTVSALVERESESPILRAKQKEKEKDWDEVTTTDSNDSREVVEIRKYRGQDENGEPATYFEERTTRYLSEVDKVEVENGRRERPTAAAGARTWRDV